MKNAAIQIILPVGRKLIRAIFLLLLGSTLALAFGFSRSLRAQEHHAEKGEKVKIPATLPEIWQEVREHQTELHNTLAAEDLGDVHVIAFAIRDYVAAMPKKSGALSKEKRAALGKSVGRIASLAKSLDEAGDAGDSAKVATLLVRLDTELTQIEVLYPAKTLKATSGSKGAEMAKGLYYCKMHPEVVSEKPGQCNKCGMDLVKKEGAK